MKNYLYIAAVCAAVFVCSSTVRAGVTQLGNSITPSGGNFTISAVQGVDAANPLGQSGFQPQVNKDFEFQGTNGVSWDDGTGKLKDFGLGLYTTKSNDTESTGLRIDYTAPVDASTVHVTLLDFDIHSGQDTFFKTQKVEPVLTLLGANNTIIATATPTQLFSALSPVTSGTAKSDTWDLDFSKVLANLNLGKQTITGFVLSADKQNGEQANSDPYLLINVGNGIPQVPEPGSYLAGLFAIAIAVGGHLRMRRKQGAQA